MYILEHKGQVYKYESMKALFLAAYNTSYPFFTITNEGGEKDLRQSIKDLLAWMSKIYSVINIEEKTGGYQVTAKEPLPLDFFRASQPEKYSRLKEEDLDKVGGFMFIDKGSENWLDIILEEKEMKQYMVIGKGQPQIIHDNLQDALKEARKIASREGIVTKVVEVVKEVEPEKWDVYCNDEEEKLKYLGSGLNYNHATAKQVLEFFRKNYPCHNFKWAVAESNRGQIKFFKLKE